MTSWRGLRRAEALERQGAAQRRYQHGGGREGWRDAGRVGGCRGKGECQGRRRGGALGAYKYGGLPDTIVAKAERSDGAALRTRNQRKIEIRNEDQVLSKSEMGTGVPGQMGLQGARQPRRI